MAKPKLMIDIAIEYAKRGFKPYPMVPNSKRMYKGSNGYLDGTDEEEAVTELFQRYGLNSNIGLNLIGTEFLIIDIDQHEKEDGTVLDGFVELEKLEERLGKLPATYTVATTTGNGEHRYFRTNGLALNQDLIGFRDGLDVIGSHINAAPSKVAGTAGYRVKSGKVDDIAQLPKVYIDELVKFHQQKQKGITLDFNNMEPVKKFTATFIEELMEGVDEGNRDIWLTRQYGRLISLGMTFEKAYEFILLINEYYVRPPLTDKEVNKTVLSIAKKEKRKLERMGGG